MPASTQPDVMDKLVSLSKRRGFIFQSSEIYGGTGSVWDYGPLGVELKKNLKDAWWRAMVRMRDDVEGLDAAILMHPKTWEASGHVAGFTDPRRGHAVSACSSFWWIPPKPPFDIRTTRSPDAASEATVTKGALLLAIYSLGLGIPFLIAAFAIEPFAAFLARFRAYLPWVERTMGALLVLTGIAFLTGFVSEASFWLLEAFPVLGQIG